MNFVIKRGRLLHRHALCPISTEWLDCHQTASLFALRLWTGPSLWGKHPWGLDWRLLSLYNLTPCPAPMRCSTHGISSLLIGWLADLSPLHPLPFPQPPTLPQLECWPHEGSELGSFIHDWILRFQIGVWHIVSVYSVNTCCISQCRKSSFSLTQVQIQSPTPLPILGSILPGRHFSLKTTWEQSLGLFSYII